MARSEEPSDLVREVSVREEAEPVPLLLVRSLFARVEPFILCLLASTSFATWLKYSISSSVILLSARASTTPSSAVWLTVLMVRVEGFDGDGVFAVELVKQVMLPTVWLRGSGGPRGPINCL